MTDREAAARDDLLRAMIHAQAPARDFHLNPLYAEERAKWEPLLAVVLAHTDAALAAERARYEEGARDMRERCSALADQLGGDRVERDRSYPDDKHGRGEAVINAMRVRAQTIATAIRALDPAARKDGEVGDV